MAHKKQQPKLPKIKAQPILGQTGKPTQTYGTLVLYPIGLSHEVREASVEALNKLLVETMTLRDLYKKHHWQVTGATFFQLHKLFDKHFKRQVDLIDLIGERIQTLGGLAIAMARHVAERTTIDTPPPCREPVPVQLSRLIEAHSTVIEKTREAARVAEANGDDGTFAILTDTVLPDNEKQVWFLSAHLVDTPLVRMP